MRKSLIARQVEYFYDNLNLDVKEKSQGVMHIWKYI